MQNKHKKVFKTKLQILVHLNQEIFKLFKLVNLETFIKIALKIICRCKVKINQITSKKYNKNNKLFYSNNGI